MNFRLRNMKKKIKISDAFREQYRIDHMCCPKCGAVGHMSTLMGYTLNVNDLESYKDLNDCTCSECYDKHKTHDRVVKK